MYNLINLQSDEMNMPIYRVFNFQRLIPIFKQGKNTLVKPALWDDPLENFILHVATKAYENHAHAFDFSAKDRFYGQCWSTLDQSDAMWRIYSPDKSGVKVATTIGKLLASLEAGTHGTPGEAFIGRVLYIDDATLRRNLQDRGWLAQEGVNSHSQAASLLFKRVEFEHEAEVRLIYLNHDQHYNDNLFHCPIDPAALFDEIQFDPRISDELFEAFHFYLREKLGYAKTISRSELYRIPELEF
ncbi:MAG TPA: DUF2971 domain-containing protein [Longimicrobium sp.]|nr:DUF2971 domain-containing protein [Longimicrobium sp.]